MVQQNGCNGMPKTSMVQQDGCTRCWRWSLALTRICHRWPIANTGWSTTLVFKLYWLPANCVGGVSQRSLHNEPIFRLLLKVAVKGTQQCDLPNFCGASCPNNSTNNVTKRNGTTYTELTFSQFHRMRNGWHGYPGFDSKPLEHLR